MELGSQADRRHLQSFNRSKKHIEMAKRTKRRRVTSSPNENADPNLRVSAPSTIEQSNTAGQLSTQTSTSKNSKGPVRRRRRRVKLQASSESSESEKDNRNKRNHDWPDISDNFDKLRNLELPNVPKKHLEAARAFVLKCFEIVKRECDSTVGISATNEFNECLTNLKPKKYKAVSYVSDADYFKRQNGEEFSINSKKKLPRSKLWVHTEKNFSTPDCLRLSHIPYIENYRINEKEFVSKLWDNYTEGIMGADAGCGEYLSDYEMFRLWEYINENKRESCPEEYQFKSYMWTKIIRFAFFTVFPNKYSYRHLEDDNLIEHFKARFDPHYQVYHETDLDRKISTFLNAYCEKCGVVDCSNHPKNLKVVPIDSIEPRDFCVSAPTPSRNRCSSKCGHSSGDEAALPTFDSVVLEQLLKARLTAEYDVCEVTKQINALAVSQNHKKLTCREVMAVAKAEASKKIPSKPFLPSTLPADYQKRHRAFNNLLAGSKVCNDVAIEPCNHEGSCESADSKCACYLQKAACTLDCKCAPYCRVLFPGCRCEQGGCKTNKCTCYLAGWECNPDTCSTCNCDIYDATATSKPICSNIAIQHGWKKDIRIGVSTLPNAGYGVFIQQMADKNELIAEYTGEVITEAETERRGIIYDELFLSYTFKLLSNHSTVDAFRMGNIIRFANHQFTSNKPNCRAQMVKVNGELRIGIYANRVISPGEELFFDYGYDEAHAKGFMGPKKSRNRLGRKKKEEDE